MPNKVYDKLKWLGLIALPGIAWFIGGCQKHQYPLYRERSSAYGNGIR